MVTTTTPLPLSCYPLDGPVQELSYKTHAYAPSLL